MREFLEQYLGPVVRQSTAKAFTTGSILPMHICLFDNQPMEGAFTLATIGISDKVLTQPDGSSIRHELLFCAYHKFLSDELYSCLFDIADYLLAQEEAIFLGQIIDFQRPITSLSPLEAFVCFSPVYFPEGMYLYEGKKPPVVIVWVIPIHPKELEFIETNGHKAFSDLLAEYDPDLMDLRRNSIVL